MDASLFMFRAIVSDNFHPFGKFKMSFPPVEDKPTDLAEVHLLTGVNGTGKSRILSLLAAILGNPGPLNKRSRKAGGCTVAAIEHLNSLENPEWWDSTWAMNGPNFYEQKIGMLSRWAKQTPAFAYAGGIYLADRDIRAIADMPQPDRGTCLAFSRPETDSMTLLQAIANLQIQAALDHMKELKLTKNESRALRLTHALETVIGGITNDSFSFQLTSHPQVTLSVKWGSKYLSFDSLPDGLKSIIGWLAHSVVMMDAWLQGESDPLQTEGVFLLDEIEAFLHPAWQRQVLPAFQKLFPNAQVFIATHSPFLIASLNHGWIHQLSVTAGGEVMVEKPRPASEGDSYVSVVEDIMGVKEWFDPETEALLTEFRGFRDAAYKGDAAALDKARTLANQIGLRGPELGFMMGKELNQMDRQLKQAN